MLNVLISQEFYPPPIPNTSIWIYSYIWNFIVALPPQAPSTSLCLSLLGLHSKPHKCGQLMLDLCDSLSEFLKPIAPGVPNPEVDYGLVLR